MSSTFVFNGNYEDKEQVRPWFPEFRELRANIEERGKYPYNDSFKGLIPGIQGGRESTAIYLLQTLYGIEKEHERVAALLDDGYREVEALTGTRRFAHVTVWREGYYSGGTGKFDTYENARVVPKDGKPHAVLPFGKRTRGYAVQGAHVLVKD